MASVLPRNCAVEATVAVIGGKWKPVILFHLTSGPLRYSKIGARVPQASGRMLTRSLRELEVDGLVSRSAVAEVPVRVTYSLSDTGRSLLPVLDAMSVWGAARADANKG